MNQISNELVSKLSTIQNAIESEKKVFIEKCRKVQEKLNFDLFDVSLRNKIIDVAHDINEANTDYYLFLKVKVDEVDSIAEKYLEKDLDYEAVERIYQVLHYINEESRIKNSFDASITEGFSTTDLGTMGVVSYSPSVHAREIELKWKSRLENMPANKKQEHYDKTQSEEQIKRTYTSKLVKWNRACKPILAQRESFIKNAIEQRASQIKVELDAEYSKKIGILESELAAIRNNILEKSKEVSRLGLFKRKEKAALKLDIQALQKNLEVLSASVNEQKKQYNNKSLSVEKQAADEVSETARIEAEKRYPYPPEPEKPEVIKREEAAEKERIKRLYNDILNCFRKTYNPMTVKDISDHYMGQMSTKDIIAALNYGKSIGTFYRQQVKNYVYWCLN